MGVLTEVPAAGSGIGSTVARWCTTRLRVAGYDYEGGAV